MEIRYCILHKISFNSPGAELRTTNRVEFHLFYEYSSQW